MMRWAAMSARFEAAGICYEVEQDPWDCREAATQPKEQATSGGKVFVSGEWVHAYAGMGQYEGFYKTSDGGPTSTMAAPDFIPAWTFASPAFMSRRQGPNLG